MLKGFRDFLMRGNVVELATAVIIGAAFTAVVTAFTDKIIAPLIAAIPVNTDFAGLGFEISDKKNPDGSAATFLDFGAVLTSLINFVIVAAVVYFLIIVPYNKLSELRTLEEEAEDDSEISLLVEIRDLLDPHAKERKAASADDKAAAARTAEDRFDPPQTGPQTGPQGQATPENYPSGGATQQVSVPPHIQQQAPQQGGGQQYPAGPPSGGFPTPNPAPGEYPPPGNLPPGQYAPGQYPPPAPGQYPPSGGQYPQDPGFGQDGPRHSR